MTGAKALYNLLLDRALKGVPNSKDSTPNKSMVPSNRNPKRLVLGYFG